MKNTSPDSPTYIDALEIENFKRVKALKLKLDEPLTIVGGDNGQGKTSVLDAIAWTLGGDKFKPSNPIKDGADRLAIRIELSNGIVAERVNKGTLRVSDPSGKLGGQELLKSFISTFALDLGEFMRASGPEKARLLARAMGNEREILDLDAEEKKARDARYLARQEMDRLVAYAKSLPYYEDAPPAPTNASEIAAKLGAALQAKSEYDQLMARLEQLANRSLEIAKQIEELKKEVIRIDEESAEIEKKIMHLPSFENIDALKENLKQAETLNAKYRANEAFRQAMAQAEHAKEAFQKAEEAVKAVQKKKQELAEKAKTLLPGLTIDEGELTYNGKRWDCMSGAEQLKVATAISHALNPKMGFVLVDGLEQLDLKSLQEFANWVAEAGMQCIATRVSKGPECSIIIEEGLAVGNERSQ